jgi:hypothetical protein
MARQYVAVFIAVLIAVVLLAPISSAVTDNTGTVSVQNETVYADHGNYTDLTGYEIDGSTVAVEWYNSSAGSFQSATKGSDYEVATTNGSIKTLASGSIDDGAELRVDYDYQAADSTTTTVAGLTPLFVALMALVAMTSKIEEMM